MPYKTRVQPLSLAWKTVRVFGFGRVDSAAAYHWLLTAPDLALTPQRWSASLRAGGSSKLALIVSGVHGFAGAVRLKILGLPRGVAATAPRFVAGGRRVVRIALRAAATVAPTREEVPITVRATAAGRTWDIVLSLTVLR